jgi:hypothetical protein
MGRGVWVRGQQLLLVLGIVVYEVEYICLVQLGGSASFAGAKATALGVCG